jgi:sterol desaturase/sphingolipid hydroxylase (fatty acid hydroxylase superfamily)
MPTPSSHPPINHSLEPIRLFKSDFLEFFTHISPVAVLVIWTPVVLWFLVSAIRSVPPGFSWLFIPVGLVLGLFLWTFAEYMGHRFVFHHKASSELGQRIFFLFHGVHHAQPQCKTRLVMPPAVSIPTAFMSYGLFYLIWGRLLGAPQWIAPSFAGFIAGYLAYDMIHYGTHHFPMRQPYLRYLKRHHMKHHFTTPDARFGVSSPLWDIVFRTMPA